MFNFEFERTKKDLQKRERNRIDFFNELYRF